MQTATAQTRDTTHLVLSTEVARKVAVDLVTGDKAREQVISLEESLGIQKEIISEQDSLLTISEQRLLIVSQSLQSAENQLQQNALLQERLEGQLSKSRAYAVGFGCSTIAAIAGIIAILVVGGK